MYATIEQFLKDWNQEAGVTQRALDALTDASLQQRVSAQDRTLGELAWHIVTALHEMLSRTGLSFDAPRHDTPLPASAAQIAGSYRSACAAMTEAVQRQWSDASLREVSDMYGMQWPNALTLDILVKHQIHHRGQLSVLMRQAGLQVPDIYGPARRAPN